MDEVSQVWRVEVMNDLECKEMNFDLNAEFDREPVELMQERSDVMDGVLVTARAAEFKKRKKERN